MHYSVCIAVGAESWLLNLRELSEEIFSRSFDDLKKGRRRIRRGEGGRNGVNNPVIDKPKDPLALEVYAQVVGVEKIGAEEWSSHIGQNELVLEGDAGRRAVRPDPRPVGGAEGTRNAVAMYVVRNRMLLLDEHQGGLL